MGRRHHSFEQSWLIVTAGLVSRGHAQRRRLQIAAIDRVTTAPLGGFIEASWFFRPSRSGEGSFRLRVSFGRVAANGRMSHVSPFRASATGHGNAPLGGWLESPGSLERFRRRSLTRAAVQQALLFTNAGIERAARAVGVLVAAAAVYWAYGQAKGFADEGLAARKEPLYGVWVVEETTRRGVATPPVLTDDTLWRSLIVAGGAQIVGMSDSVTGYRLAIDHKAGTIDFRPRPQWPGTEPGHPMSFRFSQSDREHLELRGLSGETGTLVMRLRRVDLSRSPLVNHEHSWRW